MVRLLWVAATFVLLFRSPSFAQTTTEPPQQTAQSAADQQRLTQLLDRANAELDANKIIQPAGDNLNETLGEMANLMRSATPEQSQELAALVTRMKAWITAQGSAPASRNPTDVRNGAGQSPPAAPSAPPSPAVLPTPTAPSPTATPGPTAAPATATPGPNLVPRPAPAPGQTASQGPTSTDGPAPASGPTTAPGATAAPSPITAPGISAAQSPPSPPRPPAQPATALPATPFKGAVSADTALSGGKAPTSPPLHPTAATLALYRRGVEAEKVGDINEARRWYEAASDAGLPDATLALGRLYDPNYLQRLGVVGGTFADPALARRLYEGAAARGAPQAQELLSQLPR